ncbi:hypothetical protein SO802_017692 [Lithocarpus litseifolius]|uniref:HTH myb-type domain-containing protein n=1 Tax=Lithocarpus litseifolius TaxID=425828 RepID=A0AAW2CN23_9ROSI
MQHGGLGFREYVEALEEERRKIQVFQRELPLCLELVNQAIDACRQQMSGTTTENNLHGQSESSEQTTSNEVVPAFEEFIPMKRSSDLSDDDEEEHSHEDKREKTNNNNNNDNNNDKKKSDWLRSVQLWHPSSDPPLKEDAPRKTTVMEVKRNGGAFQPFHREISVGKSNVSVVGKLPSQAPVAAPAVAVATTSSSVETASGGGGGGGGGGERRDEKDGQSQRKQRRNWSPELHKRFVTALHQLGGSHAATPKQIRELMKVDGLTNDEVKSHLQAPQFVVVGGIWVQPPEYSAAVTATTTSGEVGAANGIYAPMAAVPAVQPASSSQIQRLQKDPSSQSDERFSHSGNRGCSNSPATSSSTHTTTTSPVF